PSRHARLDTADAQSTPDRSRVRVADALESQAGPGSPSGRLALRLPARRPLGVQPLQMEDGELIAEPDESISRRSAKRSGGRDEPTILEIHHDMSDALNRELY